jgi:hypothetical protein
VANTDEASAALGLEGEQTVPSADVQHCLAGQVIRDLVERKLRVRIDVHSGRHHPLAERNPVKPGQSFYSCCDLCCVHALRCFVALS